MILESAIVHLTRNLDLICEQDGKGISSHTDLKEKALGCLANLIKNAPTSEFDHLAKSDDSEILLGYFLNILCRLAKGDKSRSVRQLSLDTVETLLDKLQMIHSKSDSHEECNISAIILSLPGVSSTLFKLVIGDTKLPKGMIVTAIRVLSKLLMVSFLTCNHQLKRSFRSDFTPHLVGKHLSDTCDNLSTRISFMLKYITTNSSSINKQVKFEALIFCRNILQNTHLELISKVLRSIVRYMAFISSNIEDFENEAEVQVTLMLLTDQIKFKLSNTQNEELNSIVLSCLFKILDNLDENGLSMLIGERQSELEMLCGLLKLLPQDILMSLLEISVKKDQLLCVFFRLTEFSVEQPFLFLTESSVKENAIEVNDKRIYTMEKRFVHLSEKEAKQIETCCHILGQVTDWPTLVDMFRHDLMQFSGASNLYITQQIIKGSLSRTDLDDKIFKTTSQTLQNYRDKVRERMSDMHRKENQVYSEDILITVFAVETFITLIDLHLKFVQNPSRRIIVLKDLLCILLNCCSSSSRAISEASMNALTQIGYLYGFQSVKSFLEHNIDYIVDGAAMMLDNFACNPEVTNVIAITFKLSSMKTFFFFKDVYEKVFNVLANYHDTEKSRLLTLLLYRTVHILKEWKCALEDDSCNLPLKTPSSVAKAISDLDIDKIILKLRKDTKEFEDINKKMEDMEVTKEDEERVIAEIQSGQAETYEREEDHIDEDPKKELCDDIVLTEKILKHCIGLMSSNHYETRILALKTAACGFYILSQEENTLLPIVHQVWTPLLCRLTQDYIKYLEENLSAFECLVSMTIHSKDFVKRRALDTIIPRICLFLESQAKSSKFKKEYEPYCTTMAYKCQLKILSDLGRLVYNLQVGYKNLWRVVEVALEYLDVSQVSSLREAARNTLNYLIALDADCIWFFAKRNGLLHELPFDLIFESF